MSKEYDVLIVGAGIVGLTIALELKRRNPREKILLIDKEKELAYHASGRNSGVLHAGFYYDADSLKARFVKEGNRRLREYCQHNSLPINPCGKLVIPCNEADLPAFDELVRRAEKNQIEIEVLSEQQAKNIEPSVRPYKKALFSPTTSTIDPLLLLRSLAGDAHAQGIELRLGTAYRGRSQDNLHRTSAGEVRAHYIVNAAGLYADKIAHSFGVAKEYRILPFKGLYLYGNAAAARLNCHVYPVPNLSTPFLGVHHTLTVDGRVKIGPTAIPALWREQYSRFSRFKLAEFLQIARDEMLLMCGGGNFDFGKLAWQEIGKYYRPNLLKQARKLVNGVESRHFDQWGRAGIRAQLYDTKKKKLLMDFCVESNQEGTHILNAISPALTCSLPFAAYVCDQMEGNRKC
jgi:L-2-hydroxyglutarate oxidase LhgO